MVGWITGIDEKKWNNTWINMTMRMKVNKLMNGWIHELNKKSKREYKKNEWVQCHWQSYQ